MLLWFLFAHFFTGFPEFFSSVYRHVCAQSVSHVWLCDPIDCTPPGSSVHGIFQARILQWIAIFFSRGCHPDSGIEPGSSALQKDSFTLSHNDPTRSENRCYFSAYPLNSGSPKIQPQTAFWKGKTELPAHHKLETESQWHLAGERFGGLEV